MKAVIVAGLILISACAPTAERADSASTPRAERADSTSTPRAERADSTSTSRVAVDLPTPLVSVAEVRRTLTNIGPDSTIGVYFTGSVACGKAITDSIAHGDTAWIDIAERLSASADGCVGEGLRDALALAVSRSPERVLRLAGDRYRIDDLCDLPFYEGTPDSVVRVHYQQAVAALRGITNTALRERRDSCLASLARRWGK